MVRRFLAKREAEKRRWAVSIVRQFIKGFIHRNEEPNEANAKFLMFVRHQYLIRLAKQLPKSFRDKTWPGAPKSCQQVIILSFEKWKKIENQPFQFDNLDQCSAEFDAQTMVGWPLL